MMKRIAIVTYAFAMFIICLGLIIPALIILGNKTEELLDKIWEPVFKYFENE